MEWISVKDRLPEDDKLKLVRYADFYGGKFNRHLGITVSRFYTPANMRGTKMWSFEFGSSQPTKVTHWCDIPSAPEVEW